MRWEDAALGVRRGAALGQLPYQTMLERQFDGIRPRDLCSVPTFAALAWNGVRPGARWPSSLRGLFDHLARRPVLLGEGSGSKTMPRAAWQQWDCGRTADFSGRWTLRATILGEAGGFRTL